MTDRLSALGWSEFFEKHFEPFKTQGLAPARVAREEKNLYAVVGEFGELSAEVPGKFRHEARSREDFPAVGDWLAVEHLSGERRAIIRAVLPRRSCFLRKQAGTKTEAQIVAANVDTALLVCALDGGRNFHLPTLERYLAFAWESGASPVIVLNKTDLCAEVDARVAEAETIAFGVPVLAVSAVAKSGLDGLRSHMATGKTTALLGPSGVGKSTLINALAGSDLLPVAEVRAWDRRGRHTTTWREMLVLPTLGIIIDTPGLREIQLWGGEEKPTAGGFDDIDEFALSCKFGDCRHDTEPGCAVLAAIAEGKLDAARLESYRNFQRELEHVARKQDERARLAEKARKRELARRINRFKKDNPKDG